MPTYHPDKVVVTRDLLFYYKTYHSSNRPPAITVAWGTDWGTPSGQTGAYVFGGYTQGGLGFSAEVTRGDIRMDQSMDSIMRPATGRTVTMTANLGEFDLDSLAVATSQGTVTTQAPTTDPGYDLWQMGSTVANNFYTVGFDMLKPGNNQRLSIYGWYAQPVGAENWTFGPENAALTPFNVTLLPDPNNNGRVAWIQDFIAP